MRGLIYPAQSANLSEPHAFSRFVLSICPRFSAVRGLASKSRGSHSRHYLFARGGYDRIFVALSREIDGGSTPGRGHAGMASAIISSTYDRMVSRAPLRCLYIRSGSHRLGAVLVASIFDLVDFPVVPPHAGGAF